MSDKIRNVLKLTEEREKEENERKAQNKTKITAIIEATEEKDRVDFFSNFQNTISNEIDKFNTTVSSKPSFGADSYKNAVSSTRESMVKLHNLKNSVDSYRKYFNGDKANEIIKQLDRMLKGYESYLGMSKEYSMFDSEDDYNKVMADAAETERLLGIDEDAIQSEINLYEATYRKRQEKENANAKFPNSLLGEGSANSKLSSATDISKQGLGGQTYVTQSELDEMSNANLNLKEIRDGVYMWIDPKTNKGVGKEIHVTKPEVGASANADNAKPSGKGLDENVFKTGIASGIITEKDGKYYHTQYGEVYNKGQYKYNGDLGGGIKEEPTLPFEETEFAQHMENIDGLSDAEILDYINNKKLDLNKAKRLQRWKELSSVAENKDFYDLSAVNLDFVDDNTYKYINDIDGFRESEKTYWAKNGVNTTSEGLVFTNIPFYLDSNYEQLNEKEVRIYNYLYNTKGKDIANEYLNSVAETLNYRRATELRNEYDTDLERIMFSIPAGIDQWASGWENLFNPSDYYAPSEYQQAAGMIREDLADAGFKIGDDSIGQIAFDIGNVTSNMLPTIFTSTVLGAINPALGTYAGLAAMGGSVYGNSYAEMINLGYSKNQASAYATLTSASEVGLQSLLGGFGKLGGKLTGNAFSKLSTKLVSNINKAFARIAIGSGTKIVGNMVSEFGEEYLQEILTPVFKNMALGTHEDFKLYTPEALYSGFLGALSAGMLEGGSTIRGEVKTANKISSFGKDVINSGMKDSLVNFGKSLSADSVAYKLANKVNEKTGAYALGRLLQEAGATLSESNMADIQKSLVRKGVSTEDAQTISKWLNNAVMGAEFTDAQISALEDNEVISQTFRDVILNQKSTVNQRTAQYLDIIDNIERGKSSTEVATETNTTSTPTVENLVESKYEVSDDGKTTNLKTGNAVEIKKIESISDSGEANLTLDDGTVVKASDIAFSSPVEALFVENIGAIKIGNKPISIDSANALYQMAMTAWKSNPDMTVSKADALIRGLIESYTYGMYNRGRTELSAKNEDGTAVLFAGELSQEQRNFAYNLGVDYSIAKAKADQKVIDDLKAKADKNASSDTTAKKGRVRFEGGVAPKGKLQKRVVSLAKHLARAIGIDIVFYDARTTTNEDGKGANGYFDEDTDTIYLDLQNSWDDAKTIVFTLSHELVHFIKKWSPEKFDTFARFLMEQYGKHGVDTSELLSKKMVELKTKDEDLAYEEMICDACETMLLDSDAIYKLMELRKTDLELFDKIKLHIHELLNKIRNMYKSLGLSPTSDEAKALLEMKDVLEQIYSLFEEAAVDAVQSYQAVQNSNEAIFGEKSIDVGKTESGIKHQLKNHKKIGEDATAYNDRHKNVHKAILKVGIEAMYEMAETMLPYLEQDGILPPDIPGKTIFKNGSYGRTGENTTLCVRTLTYEDFKDRVAEEIGRPLTVSESLLVSQKIYDIATEPQCIYCYVAADRKAYDDYLGEYWKAMDKYIKAMRKGGDSKALYEEYLAGRKDTDAQKKRWSQWEAIAKSGKEYISAKDLTTKRKRDALIAKKNAFSEQIKDAQRYAQSASWAKTVFDYRAYKGDILKMTSTFVNMLNSEYGLRMYSFSDYTPAFIVENMQMLIDASVKGLKSLAYTKDTDYAEIFASTGQAINVSCFAKWDAELGTYVEDNRQGANWEKTKSLRQQYRNVGAVMVATNDAMVEWALKQDWVDVVIPYHIVKTGTTIANEYQWNNYTSESADRIGNKTANIYPTEHNNDFATYRKLLEERGITPRFSRWYDMVESGKLTEEQYMKLVNEVRLPASELSAVVPSFNLEAAKRSFGINNKGEIIQGGFVDKGGYMGGWYREGVDVNQEVMAVSEDIKAGKSSLDVDYGMSKVAKEKVEEKYTHSIKRQAKPSKKNPELLDPRTVTREDVETMLNNVNSGVYDDNTYIPLRINTPSTLIYWAKKKLDDVIDNNPIAMSAGKAFQAMAQRRLGDESRPHKLSVNNMISIIEAMNDPRYIVYQGGNGRYVEVINYSTENGKKAFAVLEIGDFKDSPYMNGYEDGIYNVLVTTFPPDSGKLHELLNHPKNKVIFDKEKDLSQGTSSSMVPSVLNDKPFYEDIITHDNSESQEKTVKKQIKKDSEYMDAVNNGDMETAQRLVNEAAKASGYNSPLLYHGTKAFGFTRIKTEGVEEGMAWSPFFAANKEDISASYVPYGKVRDISSSMDDDAIEEERESAIEERKENITDLVYEFRMLIDRHFSPWVFGQTDNSYLEELVEGANPEPGNGDGVYDVLSDIVYDSFYDYQDEFAYDDADDWAENSPEGKEIFSKINEIEGEKSALHRLEMGEELGGIYKLFANLDNMYVVDGKGAAWNELRPEGLPKIDRYGIKDVPYRTRDVAEWARDNGFDGVIFKNIRDNGAYGRTPAGDVYVFFNPQSQVKSADPVTYDDNGNVIPLSERFNKEKDDIRFQKKTTSNRTILANALEGTAQNDIEKNKLAEYKKKIELIEAEEQKLSQIQKQLFTKDAVEPSQRKELQLEAKQIANRINTYDRQLLNLEATTALKNVLNREKSRAMKRQKQMDAEALKMYKEKAAKNVKELMERHMESRKKATESRNKTAMRHRIKTVVSELNNLLTHGNKKKHVPEDLKVAVAEVLELFNMDTVDAEGRIAKLKGDLMKAKTPEQIQEISRKIDNIEAMGDKLKARLDKLKSAYDTIKSSADPEMAGGFDELVSNRIEYVASIVGKTPLRNMSLEQLEAVYDVYTMVLNNIREANSLFKKNKTETIENYASRVIGEVKLAGGTHEYVSPRTEGIRQFLWNNLKPIFAFEKIGSKTLSDLFEDVRSGEDTWAVDVTEAKSFADSKYDKYNYNKWDFDKKYTFESTTGETFSLTLGQILSLYAYSKRPQAGDHLRIGGFVFDDSITTYKEKEDGKKSVLKYKVNIAKAHQISVNTLADVIGSLTNEQKAFVDEMQTYLSDVMGAKGNEVSMALYNIRLFKEKNYFPLKSAKQFMFEQNEVAGEVKIKNSGFTESTVEHANNPIILNNFIDVWANHVNDMAMYHAFVVPLENFNRVFNYQTRRAVGIPAVSVKETLQNAYGTHAVSYIRQLLTDLNGGARSDPRESTAKKLTSAFKKAKVFASASVVIQQPSAVARALALIDEKYFDFNPKLIKHKKRWEELKKYAPVAIIKEMGRFDTDMGMSTVDYIKNQKTFWQKREDDLSFAPAYADELVWVHIWEAVKRETQAKHKDLKVGSEEFLKEAGKRFTEVITKTQVYDSVLSRSANMRSKTLGMNMLTAFMAEPTTSINMVEQGIRLWGKGYKRTALKHFKGVAASVVLNAALVSLIYAMRDDDEDETFLEKYLGSFVSETIDGVNPLTYYPIVKDVWSLLQGYDVERPDMSLFSDIIDAFSGMVKTAATYDEEMSEEALEKFKDQIFDNSMKLVDGVAAMFGIPAGNLRRYVTSIANIKNTLNNGFKTSGLSLGNALTDSIKDITPVWGWLPDKQKSDKLYEAIMENDTAYVDRLKSGYKDDKAYETAVRKALGENDPRIKLAAKARYEGNNSEYMRITKEIKAEGYFSQDTIVAAINTQITKLKPKSESESRSPAFLTVADYYKSVVYGDTSTALAIKNELVAGKVAEGYLQSEAEDSITSSFTTQVKNEYLDGNITSEKATEFINKYGGKTEGEAKAEVKKCDFKLKHGLSWSERVRGYRIGKISESDLITAVMEIEGETREAAKEYIRFLNLEAANPNLDITADDANQYFKYAEPAGIDIEVYLEFKSNTRDITSDKDASGKTISGSKKTKVMKVINSLKISRTQKDALYYAAGYTKSTIREAPWH